MKTTYRLILALAALGILNFAATTQAQFNYTTNDGAITITGYTGPVGAVTIPDTTNGLRVTRIENWAFAYCSGITSLTISTNVTSIGNYAFSLCTGLTSLTIPDGVIHVGSYAFDACIRLTTVAFPNSLTNIPEYAFSRCTALTNLTIPSGVTNIERGVFYQCTNLAGVYFEGDAPADGPGVFADATNATVYYLSGTTGWSPAYATRPTAIWQPQIRTDDASFGVHTNQFGFNINWASDRIVVVEVRTNLANPTWSPVRTNTLADGSSYFSDPQWRSYPGRFYRVRGL